MSDKHLSAAINPLARRRPRVVLSSQSGILVTICTTRRVYFNTFNRRDNKKIFPRRTTSQPGSKLLRIAATGRRLSTALASVTLEHLRASAHTPPTAERFLNQ